MFHLFPRPISALIIICFALFSISSVPASGGTASSLNASSIFFESPIYFSGGFGASWSTAVDVNRDGKMDVLVVHQYPDANSQTGLGVLLGNGDGTFQQVALYDTGGLYATAVAAADLNADGKPDAVVTNASGVVSVLLGNGEWNIPDRNYLLARWCEPWRNRHWRYEWRWQAGFGNWKLLLE